MSSQPTASADISPLVVKLWSFIIVSWLRPVIKLIFTGLFEMEFYGIENVPLTGPIILTPNHVSYLDPILIALVLKRRLFFMTWAEVFKFPWVGKIAPIFGAFPVKLEGHDLAALRRSQQCLKAGNGLVIFPEGGRSTTGKLEAFKQGAYRLALRLDIPTIPVTINGAYQVWPSHQRWPRLHGKITIHYHKAIMPQDFKDQGLKQAMRDMTEQAEQQILSVLESVPTTSNS